MKHSVDQGGCYPQRPNYPAKAEFNKCFIILSKYFTRSQRSFAISLFVFLLTKISRQVVSGRRFNNLQRAALLTSLCREWFNMTKAFRNFGQQQLVVVN